MMHLDETPTLEAFEGDNGEKRYYGVWNLKVHGISVAADYYRLNLTPDDVEAIMEMVDEKVDDAMFDLIDEAINEYFG